MNAEAFCKINAEALGIEDSTTFQEKCITQGVSYVKALQMPKS